MDSKKSNKPKRRFAGFTDDWEQRKLGEVAEFNPKSELPEEFEYVDLESVVGTEMISHRTETKESAPSRAQRLAKTGDVFYQTVRPYQRNNYLYTKPDENYVFSTGYTQMRPNIDAEFLMSFIQTENFVKVVLNNCTGTSYPAINSTDLSNLSIILPGDSEEQIKIGSYFKNLDNLITLHQRKLEKLKSMKKSYLSEMFPQEGETKPKRRFTGFTDDWEQRKLDTITDVRDGTHDSPQYVETGHPFITSKNVKDGFINFEDIQYVSDKDYEEINKRSKVDKNDILMGMIGTIGNIALVRETPDFTIKNVALIKDIGDVFYCYLYHCLQANSVAHQLSENLDGGTQKFIALNKIRELAIPVPSMHEQHKIGDYMESLDNLITLHQRKLEKLKNIKKAYLENMFI